MSDEKKPEGKMPQDKPSQQPEPLDILVEREQYKAELARKDGVISELRDQIADLRNQIAIATQGSGVPGHLAKMVAEKMAVGLSREDAIEVSQRQVAHDAELVKQEKLAEEAKKKADDEAKAKKAAEAKSPKPQ